MTASVEIALAFVALIVMIFFGSYTTVKEGNVGITVLFGRYRRILHPGLSFRIPFAERIYKVISLQHRSVEIELTSILKP
jgi:regulator of protease activity HflC (stomatin/prohibitin superfamily)